MKNKYTGQIYAVKQINKATVVRSDKMIQDLRFLFDEMGVVSRTDHSCLMQLHEILEDKSNFNFVVELMQGGSLEDQLKLNNK